MTSFYISLRNLSKGITRSQASCINIESSMNNPKKPLRNTQMQIAVLYIPPPSPAMSSMARRLYPPFHERQPKNRGKRFNPLCSASSFIDPALQYFTGHSVVAYYLAIDTIYGGIHYLLLILFSERAKIWSCYYLGRYLACTSTRADKTSLNVKLNFIPPERADGIGQSRMVE